MRIFLFELKYNIVDKSEGYAAVHKSHASMKVEADNAPDALQKMLDEFPWGKECFTQIHITEIS